MYNVENILRNYSFIFIDIKFVLDTLWTFVLTFLKYIIQIDAFSLSATKKDAGCWKNIRERMRVNANSPIMVMVLMMMARAMTVEL